MKTLFILSLTLLTTASIASAKQIITCKNPEIKLSFDETDVKNNTATDMKVRGIFSFSGNADAITTKGNQVTFMRMGVCIASITLPKSAIGLESNSVKILYSDITPDSFTKDLEITCKSKLK